MERNNLNSEYKSIIDEDALVSGFIIMHKTLKWPEKSIDRDNKFTLSKNIVKYFKIGKDMDVFVIKFGKENIIFVKSKNVEDVDKQFMENPKFLKNFLIDDKKKLSALFKDISFPDYSNGLRFPKFEVEIIRPINPILYSMGIDKKVFQKEFEMEFGTKPPSKERTKRTCYIDEVYHSCRLVINEQGVDFFTYGINIWNKKRDVRQDQESMISESSTKIPFFCFIVDNNGFPYAMCRQQVLKKKRKIVGKYSPKNLFVKMEEEVFLSGKPQRGGVETKGKHGVPEKRKDLRTDGGWRQRGRRRRGKYGSVLLMTDGKTETELISEIFRMVIAGEKNNLRSFLGIIFSKPLILHIYGLNVKIETPVTYRNDKNGLGPVRFPILLNHPKIPDDIKKDIVIKDIIRKKPNKYRELLNDWYDPQKNSVQLNKFLFEKYKVVGTRGVKVFDIKEIKNHTDGVIKNAMERFGKYIDSLPDLMKEPVEKGYIPFHVKNKCCFELWRKNYDKVEKNSESIKVFAGVDEIDLMNALSGNDPNLKKYLQRFPLVKENIIKRRKEELLAGHVESFGCKKKRVRGIKTKGCSCPPKSESEEEEEEEGEDVETEADPVIAIKDKEAPSGVFQKKQETFEPMLIFKPKDWSLEKYKKVL
jgi:hypothetical protein